MKQEYTLVPPPKLVQEWAKGARLLDRLATKAQWQQRFAQQAAQWGADQELEACCEWLEDVSCDDPQETAKILRAARRPKPPSLKERLTEALYNENIGEALRLAEQLDD